MAAMDTNKRPPGLLAVSVHDGAKEYRARTVSTIATLPREAGGNVPAFRGLVDMFDHDEKSSATLWMGPPTSSQHDAFEAATLWLSHWLLDAGVVTS